MKFGSLVEGALLYITTQTGELWPRAPWSARIGKGVKKFCNAFLVHSLAKSHEIWHDDGHWCVAVVRDVGEL